MLWHIQGPGSLGCLWAARFATAQLPARLILRNTDALVRYEKNHAVRISDAHKQHTQSYLIPGQLPDALEPIENLLLACKAYDAESAIAQVAHRLNENSLVLLLQNGLGCQQAVQALLPNTRCIAVSSTEGAYLIEPFHTVFAGQGENWLGSLDKLAEPSGLLDDCHSAQIPCTWTDDISGKLWRKLAINCAINPLTVIHDCNNGALTEHSSLINALCNELLQLLIAAGQTEATQHLQEQVWQVIAKTAANSSSMRQDVHHRRRTEISYMTGFACKQSIALECSTPTLHALHAQLQTVLTAQGLPSI